MRTFRRWTPRRWRSRIHAVSLASSLVLLIVLAACSPRETVMRPIARLADHSPATRDVAVVKIGDEIRTVVFAPARARISMTHQLVVPTAGTARMRAVVDDSLVGARQLFVAPLVTVRGRTQRRRPRLARVLSDSRVDLELAVGEDWVGTPIDVSVDAWRPPDSPQLHETAPIALPAEGESRLKFGIGILEPAQHAGSVQFAIEACVETSCEAIFDEVLDPTLPEGRRWIDHSVPLLGFAGKATRFRFRTVALGGGGADEPASLPVWSNPTVYAPAARAPDEHNLILLSVDTLRADHLPTYGYPRDTAPFIDETFGRGGTVFDNAVAAAATTAPSHMTLFTGLPPSIRPAAQHIGWVPPVATLAELLRTHGFETGAVTEDGRIAGDRGFARGFDEFRESTNAHAVAEGNVAWTFDAASRWLARHRDERFFLFVHTYQVHEPYTPPAEYADRFTEPLDSPPGPEPPPAHDPALYDREIRFVDDQLRQLFDTLKRLDLSENTLFVLVSDHGQAFLDHGFLGHGPHVFAEITHVPLMFAGPGIPHGRRVATPVGHADLLPTLLELAGAAPPDGRTGRSVAGLVRGDGPVEDTPQFSEAWLHFGVSADLSEVPVRVRTVAVRLGARKLIRIGRSSDPEGFSYQLFDLSRDPLERHDLYAQHSGEAGDLRRLLDEYVTRTAALQEVVYRGADLPSEADAPLMDPEHEAMLRALGYLPTLDSDAPPVDP